MDDEGWIWSDMRWRERVGGDARATYREALRRAVDLRDNLAERADSAGSRAVFLVEVLDHLGSLTGYEVHDDLWELP